MELLGRYNSHARAPSLVPGEGMSLRVLVACHSVEAKEEETRAAEKCRRRAGKNVIFMFPFPAQMKLFGSCRSRGVHGQSG